jgi:hypothetical protein
MGRSGNHGFLMLHCTRSSTAADGTQRTHHQGAPATWQICSWRGAVTPTLNIHVVVRSVIALSNCDNFTIPSRASSPARALSRDRATNAICGMSNEPQ